MDKKPDKYDEAANDLFNIFDTANTRDFKWAWVKRTLRSSFPPIEVSEDAREVFKATHIVYEMKTLGHSDQDYREEDIAPSASLIEAYADKRNEVWRDALQSLYDEQNGAPLIRHADRWQAAMDKASALLTGRIREAKEGD